MTEPRVHIEIVDHTIGMLPGRPMTFRLHVLGATPQPADVEIMISDPLGRARNHMQDAFDVTGGEHVHEMCWPKFRAGQPGTYRLEVKLYLPKASQRLISSRLFEMVVPGHSRPGVLCAVERDDPIRCWHEFPAPDVEALRAVFDTAHTEVQAYANGDGSYGSGAEELRGCENGPAGPALVRNTAAATAAYVLAWKIWKDEQYAALARAGLEHLMMHDQAECGAFHYWGPHGGQGIVNDQDNFYCTGYGALTLIMAHEIMQVPGALEAACRAGDWTLGKPLTGNVNYDLFAMWFLPQLYRLTGEDKYLESAIWRTEGACFDGQNPGGAWPGHNLSFGYHSIILLGLAQLYHELPDEHPFRPRLRERVIMAAHFAASLISGDGFCYFGWEYNRTGFFVDWQGRPGGMTSVPYSPFCTAWGILDECFDVDPAIHAGLCTAMINAHKRYQAGTDRNWGREGNDQTGRRGWANMPETSSLWCAASLLAWLNDTG